MPKFASLNLAQPILAALNDEGYHTPTPIQAKAITPALEGHDLLGCAQTGTGKTAAFALPILHRLHTQETDKSRRGPRTPRALVLAPTRELANQIDESFNTYGQHTDLRSTPIFGGVSQHHQVRSLRRGVDVLVATPGRLMDLMEQRLVDLRDVEVFILDEADRMLDMGFIDPIRKISAALPNRRQTLLFSATMPQNIVRLADSLLTDPVRITVTPVASAAPLVKQSLFQLAREDKPALLEHLMLDEAVERAVVFSRTKHGADRITKRLLRSGITAVAIHGDKAQNQRLRALKAFASGRARVLVATDVAARGLDVDAITHVINYDLPNEPEAYVHRIGRTGRAGAEGVAIAFCSPDERNYLRAIERLTKKRIEQHTVPANLRSAPRDETRAATVEDDAPRPQRQRKPRQGQGHPKGAGHAKNAPFAGKKRSPHKGKKKTAKHTNKKRQSRSGPGASNAANAHASHPSGFGAAGKRRRQRPGSGVARKAPNKSGN
ncbi:MAG: DEAD/DEAH box helicase [Phycisphaerales bacterium JB059]